MQLNEKQKLNLQYASILIALGFTCSYYSTVEFFLDLLAIVFCLGGAGFSLKALWNR
jgi:hypothetical protein